MRSAEGAVVPKPILLVGLRAVGKSTVGRLLAGELGCGFVDLDECVLFAAQTDCCTAHGASIADLVREHGWDEFRERESAELARVLADESLRVVAAGGGVVERAANRALLRTHARVVWLVEDLDVLAQRIANDPTPRPPLAHPDPLADLEIAWRRREPLYAEVASFTVRTNVAPPAEIARRVAVLLREPAAPRP